MLSIEGVECSTINREGELELTTRFGKVRFTKPYAYQEIEGGREEVDVSYILGKNSPPITYRFKVGEYNPEYPLIIDPLIYSTFIGKGPISVKSLICQGKNAVFLKFSWFSRSQEEF
jgi:hypothetical protein